MLSAVLGEDLDGICSKCDNVFEQFVEVCDRAYIKSVMRAHGAKAACMSGSGTAVFGIFKDKSGAEEAYGELKKLTDGVFLCRPHTCGCEITEE